MVIRIERLHFQKKKFTRLYNDSPGLLINIKHKRRRENEKDLGIRSRTNK